MPSQASDHAVRPWRLLTSHGLILFYMGVRPGCTIADISSGLSLTPRTVYGILGDLRQAGMVDVRKEGRLHHYSVNYGAIVGHSVAPEGAQLRHVLRFLINRTLVLLDEDERA
jgi:DNA-binding transcriptional ArsR family regulator